MESQRRKERIYSWFKVLKNQVGTLKQHLVLCFAFNYLQM